MKTTNNYTISELAMQLGITAQAISKHIDRKENKYRKVYDIDKAMINNRLMTVVKLTDEDLETLKLAAGKNGQEKEATEVSTTLIKNRLELITNGLESIENQQAMDTKQLSNRIENLERQNKELIELVKIQLEQQKTPLYKRLKWW